MTTTGTTPYPNPQLPADAYVLGDWDDWDGEYRVVSTHRRRVSATDTVVSATVVQLTDGSIDAGGSVSDPPLVWIDQIVDGRDCACLRMTLEGTRNLVSALTDVVDHADCWIRDHAVAQDEQGRRSVVGGGV